MPFSSAYLSSPAAMNTLVVIKFRYGNVTVARGLIPREREENPPVTVARGPVPRERPVGETSRSRFPRERPMVRRRRVKPPHPCRSGSPDPDPFGIRRSRTTVVGPMPSGSMARDRPSPYGNRRPFFVLREERRQLPNQPHRLLTNVHHLPNQPNNIVRIRTIRI